MNQIKINKKIKLPKKVAIFDIDGTIFRSSLLIEVVEVMVSKGVLPISAKSFYKESLNSWLLRKGSYEKYISGVISAFEKNIKGVCYKDFLSSAEIVKDFHGKKIYRYTDDLAKKLKKQGYFLLAISNSPKELVDGFCEKLKFDKVYGRVYEIGKDNKFTGKTLHLEVIGDKAKILKRAVENENLSLRGSVGAGDTESDIGFLKEVDNPICFNPNKKLYDYAKKRRWKIVIERKDVIYEIN